MRTKLTTLALVAVLASASAWSARTQEAPPVAGPHQQVLARWHGTWKAECSMMGMVFEGTETSRKIGDFWVVSDFAADFMGQPFQGHSILGWSDEREAYVSTWVSSMDTYVELAEGHWDAEKQQLIMTGKSQGMGGGEVDQRSVSTFSSPDAFTVEVTHDDEPFLAIKYTRAK